MGRGLRRLALERSPYPMKVTICVSTSRVHVGEAIFANTPVYAILTAYTPGARFG